MNSLSDIIGTLTTGAGTVLGALKKSPSPVANNANATGTANAAAWLPYAIGGGVLLVIVLVFAMKKR